MEDGTVSKGRALPWSLLHPFHYGWGRGPASTCPSSCLGAWQLTLPSLIHIPSATQPSTHHLLSDQSFCSDLITLMEGKNKHHRQTFSQALLFLPPPFSHFFMDRGSMLPNLQKSPSIVLILLWIPFPFVNCFWLAGTIYYCLLRQNSASLGWGRLKSLIDWVESPAITLLAKLYTVVSYRSINGITSLCCFEN